MLPPIYIGIDAGGSKTDVLARAGDRSLHHTGDGVNLQRDGIHRSTAVLTHLISEALDGLEHDESGSICLGVAGAGRAEDRSGLTERLREQAGARLDSYVLTVEHDARIALESAFESESGMIVIVGTGSVTLAQTEAGTLERAGGWGARIGDDGSGTMIGTAGLRAAADAFDGGTPTTLSDRLAEQFGIDAPEALIRAVYANDWNAQTLAPLVVAEAEAGDWACTRILKTQANALAQRTAWLVTRADAITPRIALMGGLAGEPYYRTCLEEALQRHLPGWHVVYPSRRPVHGALALAEQRAAETTGQEIDSGG
jgi:N-acetylglucosamine kinase-like BadF-type ATPase